MPARKELLGKTRRRWKNDIKMHVKRNQIGVGEWNGFIPEKVGKISRRM